MRTALSIAEELIDKYNGEWVSKRDGFVMVKISKDGEEMIVWIRQTPITSRALKLAKKIAGRYSVDKKILLKLYDYADYVSTKEIEERFEIVRGLGSFLRS